ncbi:MAG TPA: SDR family oxidoreductase [Planctomycetota bacterium]|jgi:NAD(P)-dependent dehydrogenase (short-subunit alcohol dehydrogenase family)|nr:SDR family oxidoreductase [Planctomycetota bacterium]
MKDKVALITGGGRGIGEAIARRFASEGARVFITSRTAKDLERVALETGANFDLCDVSQPKEIGALMRKIGPVDILVNNAGIADSAPFIRTDLETWRRVMDTNVTSAFLCCKAIVPGMLERKYGRIVNIASIAGKRGGPYITAYAASKHALLGFSSSLAMELQGSGIMVNAICPGYVDTHMTRSNAARIAKATGMTSKDVVKKFLSTVGQPKLLHPGHVAEVALALAREDCSHTGASIDL